MLPGLSLARAWPVPGPLGWARSGHTAVRPYEFTRVRAWRWVSVSATPMYGKRRPPVKGEANLAIEYCT